MTISMCRSLLLVVICAPALTAAVHGAAAQDVSKEDAKTPAKKEAEPAWAAFVPAAGSEMAFSPDGRYLAGIFSQVPEVWDIAEGRRLLAMSSTTEKATYGGFSFSPDGKLLAFSKKGAVLGNVLLYDTATWTQKSSFPFATLSRKTCFTPDSKHLLVLNREGAGSITVFNIASKKAMPWFKELDSCHDFVLLGDTFYVQPGGSKDCFHLFTVSKPKLQTVALPPAKANRFHAVAQKVGKGAAFGNWTRPDRLNRFEWFDFKTGRELEDVLLDIPEGAPVVGPSAFAPSGKMAIFHVFKANSLLMDLSTGKRLAEIELPPDQSSFYAAFTADSRQLATVHSAAGVTVIWDVERLTAAGKVPSPSLLQLRGAVPDGSKPRKGE